MPTEDYLGDLPLNDPMRQPLKTHDLWPEDLTTCSVCRRDLRTSPHTIDFFGNPVCLKEVTRPIEAELFWQEYKKVGILDKPHMQDPDVYVPALLCDYASHVKEHALSTLASAMKKILPPAILSEIIERGDPLAAFMKELKK